MAKPAEKTLVTALVAHVGRSHVEILCKLQDGEVGTMRLPYLDYDEKTREYIASSAALERAKENLASIGIDFDRVTEDAPGTEFEAYVDDGRVTLWEPKTFVRFSPIYKAEARMIRNIAKKYDFKTIPLTEFEGYRFNFGINVPESESNDGDSKNFRISQFIIEYSDDEQSDKRISTKYATKDIENFRNALNNDMDPTAKERAEEALNTLVQESRQRLVDTFRTELHIDVERLLANDESIVLPLRVESIAGSSSHFLAAIVDGDVLARLQEQFGGGAVEEESQDDEQE